MNKLCFESVSDKNSKVLILGSFPSEKKFKRRLLLWKQK